MFTEILDAAENAGDATDMGESVDRSECFNYGQRVCIVDAAPEFNGKPGTIVEYDSFEDSWRLMMDDGNGKIVRTHNLEPVDENPECWVKYQIPGDEEKWAYFNTATHQTRWDPPPVPGAMEIQEMLPRNARAFIFHVVHRYGSITRGYGQICQAAARLRSHGTAALTAGASLDRADFVAACQELNLVHDDSAKIAAEVFDGIDLDGDHRGGDHILTVADFHEADEKYHSVASGAYGLAQAPLGLILFWPELVPAAFQHRAGFRPTVSSETPAQRQEKRRMLGI